MTTQFDVRNVSALRTWHLLLNGYCRLELDGNIMWFTGRLCRACWPSSGRLPAFENLVELHLLWQLLLDKFAVQLTSRIPSITGGCRHGKYFISVNYCFFSGMYGWLSGMQGGTLHTRQSSIQSDKYQVSHKYSCFSWWWAHSRPKYVEKRNKHTKKNCEPIWLY
jgi:hypothetical protein